MIISGGSIITPDGLVRADVLVRDGRIAAVGADLDTQGHDIVDAQDLWLLPGAVDAHTHFGMPLGPGLASLGWRESSAAALLGGTTTVIDFANPAVGETLDQAFANWRAMADGAILCDYGLHVTVTDTSPERLAEIPGLVARGMATFKGFLAYKNRLMLTADQMRAADGRRSQIRCHAAGPRRRRRDERRGRSPAAGNRTFRTRNGTRWPIPGNPRTEAVSARCWTWPAETGCPLTIVHMSMAECVDLLTAARQERPDYRVDGRLIGEACLHHLFRDESLYAGGYEAALAAICSPPLRRPADGQALLAGLGDGRLDLLSTDHCEFCLATKSEAALERIRQGAQRLRKRRPNGWWSATRSRWFPAG